MKVETPEELALKQLATDDERRIYLMLKDDYDSSLLVATVRKAFAENPKLTRPQLLPVILSWLSDADNPVKPEQPKTRAQNTKPEQWDTLDWDDLRYINSQQQSAAAMHSALGAKGLLFDLRKWSG